MKWRQDMSERPDSGQPGSRPTPENKSDAGAPRGGGRAGRLWGLIALSFFMAVPLMLIGEIAVARERCRATVEAEISATWGGAQTLTGPCEPRTGSAA